MALKLAQAAQFLVFTAGHKVATELSVAAKQARRNGARSTPFASLHALKTDLKTDPQQRLTVEAGR
jgi:hypothetical protein